MAHVNADLVKDTSTTTGTGVITVSGTAPTGFRTFSAVCSTNDTFWYAIRHQTLAEFEIGFGTYSAANQITRTAVYSSSNSNNAVSFSAGTKDVFITLPGEAVDGGIQTLTDGATITVDGSKGTTFTVTLTATGVATGKTLTFSNMVPGKFYVIFIKEDATGGRTITTWTNVVAPGAPTLSNTTTANATDILSGVWDGSKFHATLLKAFG